MGHIECTRLSDDGLWSCDYGCSIFCLDGSRDSTCMYSSVPGIMGTLPARAKAIFAWAFARAMADLPESTFSRGKRSGNAKSSKSPCWWEGGWSCGELLAAHFCGFLPPAAILLVGFGGVLALGGREDSAGGEWTPDECNCRRERRRQGSPRMLEWRYQSIMCSFCIFMAHACRSN